MKKLIPALCLLLISAILMGTSTYAWFSMNTQVTATGMQVKAVAEDGLLIHNELDDDSATYWKASTQASYSSVAQLVPASSSDMTNWFHNKSNDPNSHVGVENPYQDLDATTGWGRDTTGSTPSGTYFIDSDGTAGKGEGEKAYVLLNKFYIKSSGDAIDLTTTSAYQHLYINKVKVTGASSTGSAVLDKALRVAIVVGGGTYIYAPFATANVSYNVGGSSTSTTAVAVTDTANFITNTETALTGTGAIPAFTKALGETVEADVYIYFEGEDPNCKSANVVANMDTLTVEITFGITEVTAP